MTPAPKPLRPDLAAICGYVGRRANTQPKPQRPVGGVLAELAETRSRQ